MTQSEQGEERSGEILISGVDTGPEESGNETPTESNARFQGLTDPDHVRVHEPDNEDG